MNKITDFEITLLMQGAIDKAKAYLKKTDFLFPCFYLLKRGKPIEFKYKHKSVVTVESEEYDPTKPDKLYRSVIGFRITDDTDDAAIPQIIKELTDKYQPDAVMYILSCLYNEWQPNEKRMTKELEDDPTAIRLLHSCYYLKDEPKGRMLMLPYISRGKIEGSTPSAGPEFENDVNFDITFIDYFWTTPLINVAPKIPNPFIK